VILAHIAGVPFEELITPAGVYLAAATTVTFLASFRWRGKKKA
jgi:hypothetical protein